MDGYKIRKTRQVDGTIVIPRFTVFHWNPMFFDLPGAGFRHHPQILRETIGFPMKYEAFRLKMFPLTTPLRRHPPGNIGPEAT